MITLLQSGTNIQPHQSTFQIKSKVFFKIVANLLNINENNFCKETIKTGEKSEKGTITRSRITTSARCYKPEIAPKLTPTNEHKDKTQTQANP